MSVDYRETLVTYLRSESLDEAARNLNITKATLAGRLSVMKKAGVNVPKKGRSNELSSQLFVTQLNALVRKYVKEEK